MSTQDKTPNVRVPEEPEDERPIGTSEETEWTTNGLAADPYADDMPLAPARVHMRRRFLVGVIAVLILILLILAVTLLTARLVGRPPQPTPMGAILLAALP